MKPRLTLDEKKTLLSREVKRFRDEKEAFQFSPHFLAEYQRKDSPFLRDQGAPAEFIQQFKDKTKPKQPESPRGGGGRSAFATTALPREQKKAAPPRTPRTEVKRETAATPQGPQTPRARDQKTPPPRTEVKSGTTPPPPPRSRRAAPVPPPIPPSLRRRTPGANTRATFAATAPTPQPPPPTVEIKAPVEEIKSTKAPFTGVEKLGDPYVPPRGNNRHYFKGTVIGNRFYVADKPSGMEPGSLVLKIDESLIKYLRDEGILEEAETNRVLKKIETGNLSPEATEAALVELLTVQMASLHQYLDEKELAIVREEKKLPSLAAMVLKDRPPPPEVLSRIYRLEETSKKLRKSGMNGERIMSLLKQTYTEKSIAPPRDRLRKTTRGKGMNSAEIWAWEKLKQKKSSRKEENANAIGETFGNAVALAFAMPGQKQYMLLSSYEDGSLKVITDCEWQPGLKGMTDQLAGEKYQSYFVEVAEVKTLDGEISLPIKNRQNPPFYKSSLDKLHHAAQNLALFVLHADDDGFGSKLQNKMVFGDELYGIDFGHAYREYDKKNQLVENMSVDFSLDDETQKKYKNISILFDSPPTDKMLGMFYTFKSMDPGILEELYTPEEIKQINQMIEQYKEYYAKLKPPYLEFARKIDEIQPGAVEAIFETYEAKFNELLALENQKDEKNKNPQKIAELKENLEVLRKKKDYHVNNSVKMMQKFKNRMQMSPQHVTLLANLAKLTSETRSTDNEGTVALNHLQIIDSDKRLEWDLKPGADGTVQLTTNVSSADALKIQMILINYAKTFDLEITPKIENGKLTFSLPEKDIPRFSEENIKSIKPFIAKDLEMVPDLITINRNEPGAANLVRNLSLLTSLTSETATGDLYPLGNKKTDMNWKIKQEKNGTMTLNAKIPKALDGKNILTILNRMTQHEKPPIKFSKGLFGNIEINCNSQQLKKLITIFTEDRIKQLKHKPTGELRSLVLYSKNMDDIMPGTEELLSNLTTLSAGKPLANDTWTAEQTEAGTYIIQSAVLDDADKIQERILALGLKNFEYSIIVKDNRIIIECPNDENYNKLIQAVNNHMIFNQEKIAATTRVATPPEKKQSYSSIARILRLPLQRTQNQVSESPGSPTEKKSKATIDGPSPRSRATAIIDTETRSRAPAVEDQKADPKDTPSTPPTPSRRR